MVSPGCSCRLSANSMMRVAESDPNRTWTVVVNGSRCRVTDSNAMARVESGWLMRIGRVVCAPALSNLMTLARMSRTVSRKMTTRMRDNVPQANPQITQNLSVESVKSVVKPETRDPSHGPNNSADLSDHGELSLCVRAGVGTDQRRCSQSRRCAGIKRCRHCYQSSYKKDKSRTHKHRWQLFAFTAGGRVSHQPGPTQHCSL